MKGYADLADLPEDERITIIGRTAESGEIVGFFVDDDAKADRYLTKLLAGYRVQLIDRKANVLVNDTVFLRIGPAKGATVEH